MSNSKETRLPYDMGNAGDLLKHGVLAEAVRHRLIFRPNQPIRFLDLFGGEPSCSEISDETVERVGKLSECALQDGQPDIGDGLYYGSGMLARNLGNSLGGHMSVFASDQNEERRERLRKEGLRPLEDAFLQIGELGDYDAYRALEVIRDKNSRNDLILIDPFADFLEPDANDCNRAESVLPMLSQIAKSSTIVLFVLNEDPFNCVGQRFDELLRNHLSGAFAMSCPPIRLSKVEGERTYYVDVVLAGPDLVGDPGEAAYLRCRLEILARKLAHALGLSKRGYMMLRPRSIEGSEQVMPREGGGNCGAKEVPLFRRKFPYPRLLTPGRSIAGVDGCKAGWVMIRRDEEGRFHEPVIKKSLNDLPQADMVLIDIPIGLPCTGLRECDEAARKKLKERHNSVFPGARRPLLAMPNYESANAWGKKDGYGVTRQLWNILRKIRCMDAWITVDRQRTFREGHPELSFSAAAEGPMEHSKRSRAGQDDRMDALAGFIDQAIVLEWLRTRPPGADDDDILDALSLCWSAARLALSCHRILPTDHPPKDCRGLSMEMIF